MLESTVGQTEEPSCNDLYLAALKLRGLGHLVEMQGFTDPPADFREVQAGVGMVLSDLGRHLRDLSLRMEEQDFSRFRRVAIPKRPKNRSPHLP